MVLKLHGPNGVMIDLLNPSDLNLRWGGWKPSVAQLNNDGITYKEVVDVMTLIWSSYSDVDRAQTLMVLKRLDRKAREWVSRQSLDYVWIEAQTCTEAQVRYALVTRIDIPQLDHRHWGAAGPAQLTITVTHGLWRDVEPNAPVNLIPYIMFATVKNREAGGDHHYVDLPAQAGDAPTLYRISVVVERDDPTLPYPDEVMIAAQHSPAVGIRMHHNAIDEIAQPKIADPLAPGGQAIVVYDVGGSGGFFVEFLRWLIPVVTYQGRYSVYVVCKSVTGGMRIRFINENVYGEAVLIEPGTQFERVYLGDFVYPVSTGSVGLPAPSYTIRLEVQGQGASTVSIRNVFFVDTDRVFNVSTTQQILPANSITIDSITKRVYEENSSGLFFNDYGPPSWRGRWIEGEPNEVNRLYFYFGWHNDSLSLTNRVDAMVGASISVGAVNQYTALRG